MLIKIFSTFALIILIFTGTGASSAQFKNGEAAAASNLLEVDLPTGAARMEEAAIPPEFQQLLAKFIEGGGPGIKQGRVEILIWTDKNYRKSKAAGLMQETAANLKNSSWNYEIAERRQGVTLFTVSRTVPRKRAVVGFWVPGDDALVFALTEMLPANASTTPEHPKFEGDLPKSPKNVSDTGNDRVNSNVSSDAAVFNLAASDDYVNVMGSQAPKMPAFPALPKKPGKARGYVKDLQGKPLEGAYIGVRASAVGGFYSGAQTETNAEGYYEIDVPLGATEFYAAGYTIDYGEGRAAMSLYPADGKAGSFASANGTVENFVLVYHGLGDRNAISEKPWDSANYYGGSIRVSYDISSGDMWARAGSLPAGSEIEITLTPEGELLDGTPGKTFVVRRKTGGINNFNINNIPVGRYKVSARLTNGKTLKMRKTGYD
jgi:hypothetical protein